jgi:hypothetical protein
MESYEDFLKFYKLCEQKFGMSVSDIEIALEERAAYVATGLTPEEIMRLNQMMTAVIAMRPETARQLADYVFGRSPSIRTVEDLLGMILDLKIELAGFQRCENSQPCEYCDGVPSRYKTIRAEGFYQATADEIYNPEMPVCFCPNRGRKLEPREAWEL